MDTPSAPRRLGPGLLTTLGFLTAIGPFATDLYLPSLPEIGADLMTDASAVQLTLTAFLLGMAGGQLVFGPMSDRLGRRRVVLAALVVFAASSIALVFSPTIEVLIALRLVQGFSGAAGVVTARAIAADLSGGATAVRALSMMAMVTSLGILTAPLLGGVMATFTDWRGALGALAVIAVVMLVVAWFVIPESLPPELRQHGSIGTLVRRFGTLLADGGFTGLLIVHVFAFATMMAYISASSFVVQSVLGLEPLAYAIAFACGAVSMLFVNTLNARVAPRVGPPRMLLVGLAVLSTAAVSLTVQALTGTLTIAGFVLCAMLTTGGTGLMTANATALALARAADARGTASALLGSGQFLLGAIASPIVGLWGEHTAVPMALTMLTCVFCAALGFILARARA